MLQFNGNYRRCLKWTKKRSGWMPQPKLPACLLPFPPTGIRIPQSGAYLTSLPPTLYFPSLLPSIPITSLPLEVGPLNTARESVGALSPSCPGMQCLGRSPSGNRIWEHFGIKIWHLVAPILLIFLRINCRLGCVGPRSDRPSTHTLSTDYRQES